MPPLTGLPPEVLANICHFSDELTVSSFRLVCKTISGTAERAKFSCLIFESREDSFTRLEKISQVPRLAAQVTQLYYEGTCYEKLPRDQWYLSVINYSSEAEQADPASAVESQLARRRDSYTYKEIEASYEKYCRILREQEKFLSQDRTVLYKRFCVILDGFSNLDTVGCCAGRLSKYLDDHPKQCTGLRQSQLDTLMTPAGPFEDDQVLSLAASAALYLFASAKSATRVTNIDMRGIPAATLKVFLSQQAQITGSDILPMESVRKLNLWVDVWDYANGIGLDESGGQVVEAYALISKLPHLEQLTYFPDLENHSGSSDIRLSTTQFVSSRIKALDLGYFHFSIDELTAALVFVADSLRTLSIGCLELHDGHWVDVFDFMRDFLTLESFTVCLCLREKAGQWQNKNFEERMTGALHAGGLHRLSDYILHQSDERPFYLPTVHEAQKQWAKASNSFLKWVPRADF